jgi:hypothetical protein
MFHNKGMINIYVYLTMWSIVISCSIFLWSFIMKIPVWLFLFAGCMLTMTSIMGTFFVTFPNVDKRIGPKEDKVYDVLHGHTRGSIILQDSLIHTIPLVVFLLLFNVLKRNTYGNPSIIRTGSLLIFIMLVYSGCTSFENNYDFDYISLVILCFCIFMSSYKIYESQY